MNEKGFTLVELIAVIAILSILIILMVPAVMNIVDSSNSTLSSSKLNILLSKMKSYGNEYINDFQSCRNATFSNKCVFSMNRAKEVLVEDGAIATNDVESFRDPNTNDDFTGSIVLCYDESKIEIYAHYDMDGNFRCD